MSERPFRFSRVAIAAGAFAVAVLSYGSFLSTSSEAILRHSFTTALGTENAAPQPRLAKSAPLSGSEEFWLSAMRQDGGVPVTKTVSAGDKISLSFGGVQRTLEVASVAEFTPQITAIDTSAGPSHFVLVTAKDTAKDPSKASSAAALHPIRFIMEIESVPATVVSERTAEAL